MGLKRIGYTLNKITPKQRKVIKNTMAVGTIAAIGMLNGKQLKAIASNRINRNYLHRLESNWDDFRSKAINTYEYLDRDARINEKFRSTMKKVKYIPVATAAALGGVSAAEIYMKDKKAKKENR